MIIIKLADIRNSKNLSLRKLEKLSGISRSTINNLENSCNSPTLYELERLAIALEVKIEDLYESDYV